jgi:SecD/SecF fusion protein
MKTIVYSLIAIIIFGIIATSFINTRDKKTSILIQSIESNCSSAALTHSINIISNRLKDFSSEKFDITVIPGKNQVKIVLSDNLNLKAVENLLTKKGVMEFYETYNHESLVKLLNGDRHIYSFFNEADTIKFPAKIGCTSIIEIEKVNDYINSLGLDQKCKFAWNQYLDNSKACLYALKIYGDKGALIAGTDIEYVKFNPDKVSKENEIEVRLKKTVNKLWSEVTQRNINKSIAIVLDNDVISAPVVRSEINEGLCIITGDFTETQAKYIAALGNNGELPVSFKIVK